MGTVKDWKGVIALGLSLFLLLWQGARWTSRIETELAIIQKTLDRLDQKDQYMHGTFDVPQER